MISLGIVSCLYGLTIICMNHWTPQVISDFFGNDVLQDPEEFFHKEKEEEKEIPSGKKGTGDNLFEF